MNKQTYHVVIEKEKGGMYVAEVVELPGCFTQAKTEKLLMVRIKEAIELYTASQDKSFISEYIGVKKVLA